ncbi:MAG TPA: hypothetical protein VHF27_01495 [Acidimicrobiales bacterium]|nr:hypothetical protein [Acidimicrobiales bacterium]
MTIVRLRAEVTDQPGRLGRLATAIAACRGNILGLDVHFLDGDRVADEFVIQFTDCGSAEALTTALRRAGGVPVETERMDEHALVDPVARAIDVSAQLFVEESLDRGVERGAALLVRGDRARFVNAGALATLEWGCSDAAPIVRRERMLDGPDGTPGVPWALVLPDDTGSRRRWLVVERERPAFSASEVARVAALLRLARAVAGDAEALEEAARARVGPPRPVPRRPGSFRRVTSVRP